MESFHKQSIKEGFEYVVWEGKIDRVATFRAISYAHKVIVMDAKVKGLKRVCIAEDDCVFFDGGWKYFLDNMPEKYSLYLSMIYEGKIENNKIVKDPYSFAGMTCYVVDNSFYDVFLNIDSLAHIDKKLGSLADQYDYYVCNPMVAKQASGWSDNKKKYCEYDHLLKGRNLYGV